MTTEQQLAYWKHHSRQHEATVKAQADYADIKAKAEAYDQHRAATATDQEKAIQAAVAAAVEKERQESTPILVRSEFKVATRGTVTDADLDIVLGPLDLRWFLDAAGKVDSVKVAQYAQQIAPSSTPPGTPPGQPPAPTPPGTPPGTPPPAAWPDLGQGRGSGAAATPSVARGRELYRSQKKPKPTPPGGPATT